MRHLIIFFTAFFLTACKSPAVNYDVAESKATITHSTESIRENSETTKKVADSGVKVAPNLTQWEDIKTLQDKNIALTAAINEATNELVAVKQNYDTLLKSKNSEIEKLKNVHSTLESKIYTLMIVLGALCVPASVLIFLITKQYTVPLIILVSGISSTIAGKVFRDWMWLFTTFGIVLAVAVFGYATYLLWRYRAAVIELVCSVSQIAPRETLSEANKQALNHIQSPATKALVDEVQVMENLR
jgi:hypothetical protein